MSYASAADIDLRYPGELARTVAAALVAADRLIDLYLINVVGIVVPLESPYPTWVVDIAVDLALYLATPTALASKADFADRHRRYLDAYHRLQAIAAGILLPPDAGMVCAYSTPDRMFDAATLETF